MSVPAMLKVHILCRERLTSQGAAESIDATAVPIPKRTRTDGSAQQISVLNELKSEKELSRAARLALRSGVITGAVGFIAPP
jgi:hypothetical protein